MRRKLAKSGEFRAKFGEKVAIFHQSFLQQELRQKWRFWDPKLATSKNIFSKPCGGQVNFSGTGMNLNESNFVAVDVIPEDVDPLANPLQDAEDEVLIKVFGYDLVHKLRKSKAYVPFRGLFLHISWFQIAKVLKIPVN